MMGLMFFNIYWRLKANQHNQKMNVIMVEVKGYNYIWW